MSNPFKKPKAPPPPTVNIPKPEPIKLPEPEKPMPVMDDEAVSAAKRKKQAAVRQRSGRVSTILTSDNESLG